MSDANFIRLVNEFGVNQVTAGDQRTPQVVGLLNDRFVVTWVDTLGSGGDNSESAIKARLFTADGTPIGAEFIVNNLTAGFQTSPEVVQLEGGRFLVVWDSFASMTEVALGSQAVPFPNAPGSFGRIFSADGRPEGPQFSLQDPGTTLAALPKIAALEGGGFVASWFSFDIGSPMDLVDGNIMASIFDSSGISRTGEFKVNNLTYGFGIQPTIIQLATGNILVAWDGVDVTGDDSSGLGISAQMLRPDGTKLGSVISVNTTTVSLQDRVRAVPLEDGGFVLVWNDFISGDLRGKYDIMGRVFDSSGEPRGDDFRIAGDLGTQLDAAVTVLDNGLVVVSWTDESGQIGDPGTSVQVRAFDPENPGWFSADSYLVNQTLRGTQSGPAVTALVDGRIAIVWTDDSGVGHDGSGLGIKASVIRVNRAPDLVDPEPEALAGNLALRVGEITELLDLNTVFKDRDSDGIAFELTSGPDWLHVDEFGRLTAHPLTLQNGGRIEFEVAATDGEGGVTLWDYGFTLDETPNAAPLGPVNVVPADENALPDGMALLEPLLPGVGKVELFEVPGGYVAYGSVVTRSHVGVGTANNGGDYRPAIYDSTASYELFEQLFDADLNPIGSAVSVLRDSYSLKGTTTRANFSGSKIALAVSGDSFLTAISDPGRVANTGGGMYPRGTWSYRLTEFDEASGWNLVSTSSRGLPDTLSMLDVLPTTPGNYLLLPKGGSGNYFAIGLDGEPEDHVFVYISLFHHLSGIRQGDWNWVSLRDGHLLRLGWNQSGDLMGQFVTVIVDDDEYLPNPGLTGFVVMTAEEAFAAGMRDRPSNLVAWATSDADFVFNLHWKVDGKIFSREMKGMIPASELTEDDDVHEVLPGHWPTVLALAGNDTVHVRAAAATVDGGAGDDSLFGGAGDDRLYGREGQDLLTGNDGADYLLGGDGDDSLFGGAGGDRLDGGAGDDTLDGGAGDDTMAGRRGDDIYFVDSLKDLVIEFRDQGRDTINTSLAGYVLPAHVETLILTGDAALAATGNGTANLLRGNSGANTLWGAGGDDTLEGLGGNDTLYGGAGRDRMIGGAGDDTYFVDSAGDLIVEGRDEGRDTVSTSVSYALAVNVENLILTGAAAINGTGNVQANRMTGNAAVNVMRGAAGNDEIRGNGGNDVLRGGAGKDRLFGGNGNDQLFGEGGADTLYGDAGNDSLSGGAGIDRLFGGAGRDRLSGDAGNDHLFGQAGNDSLFGGAGNDSLFGGAGADRLTGGLGADRLTGGAGNDVFDFNAIKDSTPHQSGQDVILDFRRGDRIDISDIDANTRLAGNQDFSFVGQQPFSRTAGELRYERRNGDTFVYADINGDGRRDFGIRLDADLALRAADFIL